MENYKAAVIGAAGYTGTELVKLLLGHPGFDLVAATSTSEKGVRLDERYPALLGHTDLRYVTLQELGDYDIDLVFLAVPHNTAMDIAPKLMDFGITVIDLSADFRLKDADVYRQWYNMEHVAPSLLETAVYGLPELNRNSLLYLADLRESGQSVLVACPGCYPTASALAASPALAAGAMMPGRPVVINALSGASGMGSKATEASHFVSVNEEARAYNVGVHRHTPEIEQTLSIEAGQPINVQFTPHLIPMNRGLISTVAISLLPGLKQNVLEVIYATAYSDEPFVNMLPYGVMPKTSSVMGTNQAQIGIFFDAHTDMLVASCAIDNLGKGASAQAIQCANIVYKMPETTGLDTIGMVI